MASAPDVERASGVHRGVRVVVIAPMTAERAAELARVDPCVEVIDAWELFAPELVADWPSHTVDWYLPAGWHALRDSDEQRHRRDALLSQADAICITFPFPTHLRARAPRLRLVHQLPAGVSNLRAGDLWQGGVPVTSGRGAGNTLAIAEWAIAATLALVKEYPRAFVQRQTGQLSRRTFRPRQLAEKTMGVVGLGGIGRQVARLASGLGMHVIGSRRSLVPVAYVERLYPPSDLLELLGRSEAVVLATQLTPETNQLMDARALAAMRPGAVLINVARGELIDEAAVLQALRAGRLAGFATDVYMGEFEHQPPADLLALDNVLVTPHTSGMTDHASGEAWAIFRENLRRLLGGEPLLNQVDWARGY